MRGSNGKAARPAVLAGVIALAGITGATTLAQADDAEAVRAGWALAVKECSSCHVIAAPPISNHTHPPVGPSFEVIAKGTKSTPEALRAFLLSTHSNISHPGAMPRPPLTEDQIRLIAAYMSSLRAGR